MLGHRLILAIVFTAAATLPWGCAKKEPEQPHYPNPESVTPPTSKTTPVLFDASSLHGKTEKGVEKILGKHGDRWIRGGFEDDAPPAFWRGQNVVVATYGHEDFDAIDVMFDKDTGLITRASFFFPPDNKLDAMTAHETVGVIVGDGWESVEREWEHGRDVVRTPNGNVRGYSIKYAYLSGEIDRIIYIDIFY